MNFFRRLWPFFFGSIFFFITANFHPAEATKFDLIGPTDTLTSGQQVKFTVTIDTQGKALASTQIGMTYKTNVLQFVNIVPGTTFSNLSSTPDSTGNIVITGSSATPFSGTGDFAYVTFKIIATSPGSTDLCVLYVPSVTPTVTPNLTQTPTPVVTARPTAAPTSLPRTGTATSTDIILLGITLLITTAVLFFFNKKTAYSLKPKQTHIKKP
ncbi:LPXTG cell wall anchor domain-containing protein [Candidatus Roizmanbacteria bacterium]|nr:LPXTG cell wall anchor domain-containing protein [Candidatus Roizmanbacteria bacterium]